MEQRRDIEREAKRLQAVVLENDDNGDDDSFLRGEYRPIPATARRRNTRTELVQSPVRRRRKRQRPRNDDEDDIKSQSTGMPQPLNISAMSSLATKPLPTFDDILGPDATELEEKENPILPDEERSNATRDNFCYICEARTTAKPSLLQGAPKTEPLEFLISDIAPFFASKRIGVVIKAIRAYFNTVIRPYMDPKFKQRWTSKQIFFHFFDHTHEYTGVLLKQACKDIMIKSIETGISFSPDFPRDERVTRDLVPTLVRLYNIIKEWNKNLFFWL